MAVITVPKVLREKLGEDGADSLVELINKADAGIKEDVLVFVDDRYLICFLQKISRSTVSVLQENGKKIYRRRSCN